MHNTTILFRVNQQPLDVLSLHGHEGLSCLTEFTLTVLIQNTNNINVYLGKVGQLQFSRQQQICYYFYGLIQAINVQRRYSDGRWQIKLRLISRLERLKKHCQARIFTQQSIPDIVTLLLMQHKFAAHEFRFNLINHYPQHDFLLQPPHETDLHFLQRILAQAGIFFYDDHSNSTNPVIFTDSNVTCSYLPHTVYYVPNCGTTTYQRNKHYYYVNALTISAKPQIAAMHTRLNRLDNHHASTTIKQKINATLQSNGTKHAFISVNNQQQAQLAMASAQQQAEQLRSQSLQIQMQSQFAELTAGLSLSLNADALTANYTNDYLITRVRHHCKQAIGCHGEGHTSGYENNITAIPLATTYRPPHLNQPIYPNLLSATISSQTSQAELNNQGYYRVHFEFAKTTEHHSYQALSTPPLPLLLPFAGPQTKTQYGIHFPLQPGNRVLISFIDNNINLALILGVFADPKNKGHSSAQNDIKQQNSLSTPGGNQLILDDTIQNKRLQLATHLERNLIQLNHDHAAGINIKTTSGTIALAAKQAMILHAQENIIQQTQQHLTWQSCHDYRLTTKQGTIILQAGHNIHLQAVQAITVNSQRHCCYQSETELSLTSQDSFKLNCRGHYCNLLTTQGQLNLISGKNIHFSAQQGIYLGNKQAHIKLDEQGKLLLQANSIIVQASKQITIKGQVNHKE